MLNANNQKVVISYIKYYYVKGIAQVIYSPLLFWAFNSSTFWFTYTALISGAFGQTKKALTGQYSWCLAAKESSIFFRILPKTALKQE